MPTDAAFFVNVLVIDRVLLAFSRSTEYSSLFRQSFMFWDTELWVMRPQIWLLCWLIVFFLVLSPLTGPSLLFRQNFTILVIDHVLLGIIPINKIFFIVSVKFHFFRDHLLQHLFILIILKEVCGARKARTSFDCLRFCVLHLLLYI